MSEKFVGYFRLLEACAGAGCPVCRSVAGDARRHLDALLYEQVTDLETRRRLRAAGGLCNWHTWMLPQLSSFASGSAILYEDMLRVALRRVEGVGERAAAARRPGWRHRLRRLLGARSAPGPERAPCPACGFARDAEQGYLDLALRHVDDPDFSAAYARSAGLCVPHLALAVERADGGPRAAALVRQTAARWEALRQDLERFVAKHDHRNTTPVTDAEASACTRAFETIAGAPGFFPPDLDRTPPPR